MRSFLSATLLTGVLVSVSFPNIALSCDYYASPTGNGNGLTESSPFKISSFWSKASAGKTLCLLNGTYRGSDSMINPPDNKKGASGKPITVKALNDGKVTIDGQHVRMPVNLYLNNYFVLEGFNAHSSSSTVVLLKSSSNNIVRRVAAWDSANINASVFGIHTNANHNLLEDVAAWGIARKVYSSSQGGNHTVIRRAWGRWDGSNVTGPKTAFELSYRSKNMIVENIIAVWSGERQSGSINQPFHASGNTSSAEIHPHNKLFGSISYIPSYAKHLPGQAFMIVKVDDFELKDVVAYVAPNLSKSIETFMLTNLATGNASGVIARNLTSIGGNGASIHSVWNTSNIEQGATASDVSSIYTGAGGAKICKRYVNGVLTNQPLWPWPMNQRIIDAMKGAGKQPVNVTQTIEQLFGKIPNECRGNGGQPPEDNEPPEAPANLRVVSNVNS